MPSAAGASDVFFARFGKMRNDTSKKYGCIVVSDASKSSLDKSPLRRPLYVRPANKDDRRGLLGGGMGRNRGWNKVAESRVKASMRPSKTESRIIKHNLEKSKQLISEENEQEQEQDQDEEQEHSAEEEERSPSFYTPSPEPDICQVDGIPVQFGPQSDSSSAAMGTSLQRQATLRAESSLGDGGDGFAKENGRPLHSPEYVGQDIVYHVFYQDNPLDIIESLLVARRSYDSEQKLAEDEQRRTSEALAETLGKLSEQGRRSGADNLSTQESATLLDGDRRVGTEGAISERLGGISEEVPAAAEERSKPSLVEETPRRHHFRSNWDKVPAMLKQQDEGMGSLAFGDSKISEEMKENVEAEQEQEQDQDQGRQIPPETISWNISSPEAENMEQSLLQLLNARLQVLSSHKLKYLLGVMDKLEGGDGDGDLIRTEEGGERDGAGAPAVSKTHTLSLRILSTWGDKNFVGVVQIDVFDTEGKKIDVEPGQISSNCEATKALIWIFDGDAGHGVWEALLPSPESPPLEIVVQLPSQDTAVGHLEIWNHYENVAKGVRGLQVLIDGEMVWEGTVAKSSGTQLYDSCSRIQLVEVEAASSPSPVEDADSISITPPSPKLDFEASRPSSMSPRNEGFEEIAADSLETDLAAAEKIETESIWSRAARYLQRSIISKKEPEPEPEQESAEDAEADFNLNAEIDKLEEDNMELEELERILNSADDSNFYSKYEHKVTTHKIVSGNLAAEATYEMFNILDESGDEAALLQALDYTEDTELDGEEQQITELPVPRDFTIPLLPLGSKLTIDIHSSWGDPSYVGLSGIEIFDDAGELVYVDARKQISVSYTTAALLSGLHCSPCPLERLVDNVNLTCDDSHMWLAPFSPGHPCCITISLDQPTLIGMIRFWNYNKSTMHTYRGARLIRMFLDSQLIFSGELRRGSGMLCDAYSNTEPILFTTNEATLSCIESYDSRTYKIKGPLEVDGLSKLSDGIDQLMFKLPVPAFQDKCLEQALHDHRSASEKAPTGRVLRLNLLRSWGDCYYFGLTGIQARTFHQNSHYFRITFLFWTRTETRTRLRVSISLGNLGI